MALNRTLGSLHDSRPSFESVEWTNNISTSKFTLFYQYLDSNGAQRLAKGTWGPDNRTVSGFAWRTYDTQLNIVYRSHDLLESFSAFSRFMYLDEIFYLTEVQKLQNGVQLENQILLTDESMTPLALLNLQMPKFLNTMQGNYTAPVLTRINDTVSVSFEHFNETHASGTKDYTQFVYFVDLRASFKKLVQKVDPVEEEKSFVTRVLDVIVAVANWFLGLFR